MEKEKELRDVRHHLEEQRREREEEVKVKALLEKQVVAVEEATEKLKTSHQQEINDLMEKHQQEVGLTNCTNFSIIIICIILQIYDGFHFKNSNVISLM